MKKVLGVLLLLIIAGCDDGDQIVTDFDFNSESKLQFCENGSLSVLYVINSDPEEAIAFSFSDTDFDGTFTEDEETKILTVPVSNTNTVIYRTFDEAIPDTYFCSGIPPSKPAVKSEFKSQNGGSVVLTTTLTEEKINETENTVRKTFRTWAEIRDVTLKNSNKDEEIVRESLKIGSFTKTLTLDLDD